ncbi:MAG TPA: transposase [Isosphaeraceae bacterium]|nr:transposase [Isosphaeraceae bacterium]
MFTWSLPPEWVVWIALLAQPLHGRLADRLDAVVVGILLAHGRRTAASWWRAAGIGPHFRLYYYFLDSIGRKTHAVAAVVFRLVLQHVVTGDRLLLAVDDTPTARFGPKVQGAGVHHDPTPGPAGGKFLYGHVWVLLACIVRHVRCGTLALPLLASLYVRRQDVPTLPASAAWHFQTKLQQAADLITWASPLVTAAGKTLEVVVDGGYAKKEVLRPAQAAGVVLIGRLRKDAALYDLPPVVPPGQRRPGRPRIYGYHRLSLAKRAGQTRGWQSVSVVTTTGATVTRRIKTFLATWHPAGGVIRVVIIREEDGSWRAFFRTDLGADAGSIAQTVIDRWGIEQANHDLKEVEGIGQVQLRRIWSNVGALNLDLWVHTLVELWAWDRPTETLSDRGEAPWDDATRRPSHADRRKALQRMMLEQEFSRSCGPTPVPQKIRHLFEALVKLVA